MLLEDNGSDHLPIAVDVLQQRPPTREQRRPSWSWKKARWEEYTQRVEDVVERMATARLSVEALARQCPDTRGVKFRIDRFKDSTRAYCSSRYPYPPIRAL